MKELLPVVFGILIAFKIDSWHEGEINRKNERVMLTELQQSIKRDTAKINKAISENEEFKKSAEIILYHLTNEMVYHDSLDKHFSRSICWYTLTLENQAYESIKSIGINSISDNDIRKELGILENNWLKVVDERNEKYHFNVVAQLMTELFQSAEMWGEIKPNDYDELVRSKSYKHVLRTLISNKKWGNRYYEERKRNLTQIINTIDKYQSD